MVKKEKDKKYIYPFVSSGMEKPYYLAKKGMSPKGCHFRVGSGNQQMTSDMIKDIGLVEQLGSGMSRILHAYYKSIF